MQYPCFTLARVLYDLKDYEQALKYYDKTIELYEEYAQAYIIIEAILKLI
ncbi:tetratricopeptide repeat protein [Campylobacter lari]|nr:tetratricopeptide repeat protein [Campylobacter lari]